MRWNLFFIILAVTLACLQFAYSKGIKTLTLFESDVAQVNVALGYSTLLQFDARPTQAIVGDQDSFKVEYVGNSIAIKPIVAGVSTNLFVVTEYDKFNFKITAGHGFEPDYILRIKKKKLDSTEAVSALRTRPINATKSLGGISLTLQSVAATKTNTALIYTFRLASKDRRLAFQPGDFSVLQSGRSLPIENLYIERLSLGIGEALSGMVMVRMESFNRKARTTLMFHPASFKEGIQLQVAPI